MLSQVFPRARFSSPASEAAIASAAATLGVRLPDPLRRLYLQCDGFREDRGNAKYLLSLTDEDHIGSLVSITRFMWTEFAVPDLKPFVFFCSSSSDEFWGINWQQPSQIIAYHHHMEEEYEIVGSDIVELWQADYARYEELAIPAIRLEDRWRQCSACSEAWEEDEHVRISACPSCRQLTALT